jgi:helicase
LRALASELLEKWQVRFAGFKIGIFTGDYGQAEKPYPVSFQDAQLYIMTPERLDACTRAWTSHWDWIPKVDLIVVDEFHLLNDASRGPRLEGTLSRIRRLNPFARIVGLSATLGNSSELASWLDAVEYVSDWRPISLEWHIVRFRKATDKPDLLVREVARNKSQGGRSLIFVHSRRRAEALSRLLESNGFAANHHHAGLSSEQRKNIEQAFRHYELDALVSTSTMEMGMNLPVRQVIVYDLQYFDGKDFVPLPTNNVWQRVGRAGRMGLDDVGEAVLFAPIWDKSVERYERGQFEPVTSGLSKQQYLEEQIVLEVASRLCRTPQQLEKVFEQSLAYYQRTLPNVQNTLKQMIDAGLLVSSDKGEKSNQLAATRLGWIASRHFVSPQTIILFKQLRQDNQQLYFFDLLLFAVSAIECEPIIPVNFEDLDQLASFIASQPSQFMGLSRTELRSLLKVDGKRLLAALKMAVMLRTWTQLGDAETTAQIFDCYAFELLRLRESSERLLMALVKVLEYCEQQATEKQLTNPVSAKERVVVLHKMIASGLDEYAITLTLIDGIGSKTAKNLSSAGIRDVEDLALADIETLVAVPRVSEKRARKWIPQAEEVIRTRSAWSYREDNNTNFARSPMNWNNAIDPYRLRRACDLIVQGSEANVFLVTGGLEPHRVLVKGNTYHCDCTDASKGNICKHELAIRMIQGDKTITQLVERLSPATNSIDLFDLWFNS